MPKIGYYAVRKGRQPGIYRSWSECQAQVDGFTGAEFKKFSSFDQATHYLASGKVKGEGAVIDSVVVTSDHSSLVFTDGACCKVGPSRELSAGYGYYIPSSGRRVCGKIPPPYTNNRAELTAAILAIQEWPLGSKVEIVTDSKYVILIFTGTGLKYRRANYQTSTGIVPNRDLVALAVKLSERYQLTFTHVNAHTNGQDFWSCGNRIADQLAVAGAKRSSDLIMSI